MKRDDGGPAFPRPASVNRENGTLDDGDEMEHAQDGPSLRDWFAGQALAGIVGTLTGQDVMLLGGAGATAATTAAFAYHLADAMLKARARTGNVATQETQS